ncbi:Bug family tripartite tricarboxylate transporter substrate binding protein [Noviherbaspirillum aerium]|uniref:Bug family tripartite tricarboxylate transporter substrate binding protein n=1 Tax=Noviherbaspirillum aerium TaxID=2588497 RepID=UPI00124C472C|nr:tripartite tricarboxylate transporter substrate binding protein [Noviherbaspirillum aerium]
MSINFSTRRRTLAALVALSGAALAPISFAQNYPSKPIRLIVPFTVGGVTDSGARVVAEQLSRRLGQQVIVDNRPGASGNIGTQMVSKADPDGYTLLLSFDGTMVINPHVYEKIPFDTVGDFAPVGKVGDAALILVAHPSVKAKNWRDLVAESKAAKGGLSYGTSGVAGTPHIAGELLRQKTGVNLSHVPYKGGGQAMGDVMGGNIPLVFTAVASAYPHLKSGKVIPIAVATAQRVPSLPDVPTFMESGVTDFQMNSWIGIFAPIKTPRPVVDRLNGELNAVLNDPDTRTKLDTLGITATPGTPEKFGEEIKTDLRRFRDVVKAAAIKLD